MHASAWTVQKSADSERTLDRMKMQNGKNGVVGGEVPELAPDDLTIGVVAGTH